MFINVIVDLFFTLLYKLVHITYAIIVFLKRWLLSWQRKVNLTGDLDSLKFNLIKLPHHIVFVVNFNDNLLTINDVASLVTWSIKLGINNISLYDSEGFLISYLSDLENHISQQLNSNYPLKFRGDQQNGSTRHNIIFHCDYSSSKVRVLSLLDSKAIMAMVLKEMIKHDSDRRKLEDTNGDDNCDTQISPEKVDQLLFSKLHLPDPDLAILCGPTPCLFGLLPWHIRLTEFIHLPIFGKLIQQDFISVISRYTKCEQRFGK
ncbi:dehydrodolichyl diphosphate synthase complex subunit NUS1-like [Panonychus citri]|uniref:dehydrodolichyl diphosphate synthase complex subunit NUS1-like n=1 Tax=Panonychus citri TaxID=50023 RepID=UPI002307BF22|nr:dehydrodolichyl diphosphate synthase complex subunit NUS1-like [Panonychus citri]XP_053213263.1 dehydrodolichyl diphosphate synthase complex subunit NUS1-like [Panonychus citri]